MKDRALLAVFLLALAARLGFLFFADQPLLYTHQYTYFTNGLRIAEHESPVSYVLTSDAWRTWDRHWTIAPLYFVFLGAMFSLVGPHLVPILALQCVMDAAAAAGVALLGREAAGDRRGHWAGVLYALYAPAIEMPSWTMTENLHTPLFVAGMLVLVRAERARGQILGGAIIGLSALARAVSTGFLGLAAFAVVVREGLRRGWRPGSLVLASGLAIILPWTARNVFVVGDAVLIESAAFENLWWANTLVDRPRYVKQAVLIDEQATPADKRKVALHFALRGIRRDPAAFVDKVKTNFRHFLRPEGLQNFLRVERSLEPWRHVLSLLADDFLLVVTVPLFVVYLLGSPPSRAWGLIVAWTAFYLFMVVVVFHNEIRYRSALVPFAFAGAVAALHLFAPEAKRRSWRLWAAAALGLVLAGSMVKPYLGLAWRALAAWAALGPALDAVDAGDLGAAEHLAAEAAAKAPRSPRPWFRFGRHLAQAGHPADALAAYERGGSLATPANWSARLVRPQLLRETGRPAEAEAADAEAYRLSWDNDPWLALEAAWRELPAPRTDAVILGRGDYGAVRGFLYPKGGDPAVTANRLEWNRYEQLGDVMPPPGPHRWSRHRAWVRMRPTYEARTDRLTLVMGMAFPSPIESAPIAVRVGATRTVFDVGREIRPYRLDVSRPADGVFLIQIDSPTWNRAGEPAEQGVRVDSVHAERIQ